MAEQLVNLYGSIISSVPIPTLIPSVTLAAPYTAGSGSIHVSSPPGPSTGTFSLTILNAQTGAVYLIFRVASVAGNILSGAAEGPDANAPLGAAVVGTMLTVDAINQIKADILPPTGVTPGSYTSTDLTVDAEGRITAAANGGGGGGGSFFQTLTAPNPASFSAINFNTGGCTTTQVDNSTPVGSISLTQLDPASSLEIAGLTKAPINPLFTITIAFTIVGFTNATAGLTGGLWLTDGSAVNLAFFYNGSENFLQATVYANFAGSFSTNAFAAPIAPFAMGPLVWLRIQETVSARIYLLSADGINFVEIFSESNTAHLTTAQYGVFVEGRNVVSTPAVVSMGWYSFTETTP